MSRARRAKPAAPAPLVRRIESAVERHRSRAVEMLQRLIRIPSVNHPPTGDEKAVQEFYAKCLRSLGLKPDVFNALDVRAFRNHPGRLKDHDMAGRPNVAAVLRGTGGGRSLMLLAHADTESTGDASLWTGGDPFSGRLVRGRIFGRGAGDDKCGMMIAAMVVSVLKSEGIRLRGDLVIGSVADEEQAGSNGIVALLAKGYKADAAIYLDGAEQDICVSNLGGGYATVDLRVKPPRSDSAELLRLFDRVRRAVDSFRRARAREFARRPLYNQSIYRDNAVRLCSIRLAEDDMTHGAFTTWFYLLPGENARAFQRRFEKALAPFNRAGRRVGVRWMSRFLVPSEVRASHPFVRTLARSFALATRQKPRLTGSMMSDMGFVNRYGRLPCLIFGPGRWGREGMAHQPDEFVEVDVLMSHLKTTLLCALDWCGWEDGGIAN